MQTKIIGVIAGVIAIIAAAFAGGYYFSRQSPQVAQAPTTVPITQTPATAPVTQAPTDASVTQGPTADAPAATPSETPSYAPSQRVRHRYHDYADRDYEEAPPPPPPPPSQQYASDRPDPFEGRFSLFPMRHQGDGTTDSPLSFVAQTVWGDGREADLRISIVVPEPPASDRGEFWREWGQRDRVDLMPEITRGTPVIVTGSAAAIVTIDPAVLDLDAPAILLLRGPDGQRIYRSRDVAPARGASWDSPGVRWLFAIDADLYNMLRDGADAMLVVRHRGRNAESDVQIPFSTSGFQDGARGFEGRLSHRINDIAAEWQRAQPGGMAPPPVAANNPPPPPAQPPHDWQSVQSGPAMDRNPAPQSQFSPPPPAVAMSGPPTAASPPVASPSRPATPAMPAALPGKVAALQPGANEKTVADFHPPTDNCGPQPAYAAPDPKAYLHDTQAQLNQADVAVAKAQTWIGCRQQWLAGYQTALSALRARLQGGAIRNVPGGMAIVDDFQAAHRNVAEQSAAYARQAALLARAHAVIARQPSQGPPGVKP